MGEGLGEGEGRPEPSIRRPSPSPSGRKAILRVTVGVPTKTKRENPRAVVPRAGRWACIYIDCLSNHIRVYDLAVQFLTLKFDFLGKVRVGGCGIIVFSGKDRTGQGLGPWE